MLNSIEINTIAHHKSSLTHTNNHNRPPKHNKHPPSPQQPPLNNQNIYHMKRIIPIKQYSNKFLRESNNNAPFPKQPTSEIKRLDHLVTKHKRLHKKYVFTRNSHICKTEPNENQYKCFATSYSFHNNSKKKQRTNTEEIICRNKDIFDQFSSQMERDVQMIEINSQMKKTSSLLQNKARNKLQPSFGPNPIKNQQKISASRALQLYSKILSKDKYEIAEKIKSNNQKKLIKEKITENTKNLQTKQIVMFQKQKKMNINLNLMQKRLSSKINIKFRTKIKSEIKKIFVENDNFELRGWDIMY